MFSLQLVGEINRRAEEPNPVEDNAATAEAMLKKQGKQSLRLSFLSPEKMLMTVLTH